MARDSRQLRLAVNESRRQADGRVELFSRLAPLLTAEWDVCYFPWNASAIDHLPLFNSGRPCVISCRGSQIYVAPLITGRAGYTEALRETLRLADMVHCVSEHIAHEAERYGLAPEKACVIHPAVDTSQLLPALSAERNECRFVAIGNLSWVKGFEYLLTAFRLLLDRGISAHLDVVGAGPERDRYEFTVADLNLSAFVTFHGAIDSVAVSALLTMSDVFVLSSVSEGISNALLEAMAHGLAVVTTECGGVREVVTDGVDGLVVPVRDVVALARGMERVARDTDFRRSLGAAARARVVSAFDSRKQIASFVSLFNDVASRAESRA